MKAEEITVFLRLNEETLLKALQSLENQGLLTTENVIEEVGNHVQVLLR